MISANVLILISDIKYRNLKTYQHGVISSHSHQTEVFQKTTQPHRLLHPSMLLTARARNLNSSNKNELYGLYLISLRQFLPWGNSYLIYHYLNVTTSQPNDWKDVTWDYFMWLLLHIVTSDCWLWIRIDVISRDAHWVTVTSYNIFQPMRAGSITLTSFYPFMLQKKWNMNWGCAGII